MVLKRYPSRWSLRVRVASGLVIVLTAALGAPASAAGMAPATASSPPVPLTVVTSGQPAVTDLRTNYLKDPLGVDAAQPALSWTVASDGYNQRQTHYRVEAAATVADLTAEDNLLWDTGRVAGDQDVNVAYQGIALVSRQRVYWRVKVWNGDQSSRRSRSRRTA